MDLNHPNRSKSDAAEKIEVLCPQSSFFQHVTIKNSFHYYNQLTAKTKFLPCLALSDKLSIIENSVTS